MIEQSNEFYAAIEENNTRKLKRLLHQEDIKKLVAHGADYAFSIGSDESCDLLTSYIQRRNYVTGKPKKNLRKVSFEEMINNEE